MLADLVDLLAGNAPVITQLNNHLFSSGLIPKAIHLNSPSRPYDRATELINAVLATLECHPNPNSVFTSLITALHNVGLVTFATKLTDAISKPCISNRVKSILLFLEKNGGHITVVIERKPQPQNVEPHPSQQKEVAAAPLQPLHKQKGRSTIATKLMGFFSKFMHH